MFLASDVSALVAYTKRVVYFEDREVVTLTRSDYVTSNIENEAITKAVEKHLLGTGGDGEGRL